MRASSAQLNAAFLRRTERSRFSKRGHRGTSTRYAQGDALRVAVESGRVRYYQNGQLLYENPTALAPPLWVDTSLYEPNASLGNFATSGAWQ